MKHHSYPHKNQQTNKPIKLLPNYSYSTNFTYLFTISRHVHVRGYQCLLNGLRSKNIKKKLFSF